MSTIQPKHRASLCTFTFSDGRRCRTPRQSGHPLFCCFHARKHAQSQAADQLGGDFLFLLSGDHISACDLAAALSRLFAAVARGVVKPRTASTLAYLAQTLLLTIQIAEKEYTDAFGHQALRKVVSAHVRENQQYLRKGTAQPAAQPGSADHQIGPAPVANSASQAPQQPSPQLTDQASQPAKPSANGADLTPLPSTLPKVIENK
jgi:hypothetical protein